MSCSTEPRKREYPNTYVVQDRSNEEEFVRLGIQDKMLTAAMGGVLPELADHARLQQVLDVGCGTGGWLLEMARTYPSIEKLVGVDIDRKTMAHARAQVSAQGLDKRVRFQKMDALCRLEFPVASFDLVNQRSGCSWLRTWDWQKVLSEYQRVTRPDGSIRITECYVEVECNSPALTKLYTIALEAVHRSGRLFTATSAGLTDELPCLMTRYGIQDVQTQVHTLICRAGTPGGQYFYQDMLHTFRVGLPFLQKWASVPSDYSKIYEQALKEVRRPGFVARWTWLTAWGKPLPTR